MPIRLLAVDLDGTLLNSQQQVSSANRQALQAAARLGVQIVVVTGRRFHSARPFLEQLQCAATVISSNGARIGSLAGEVYHRDFLPAALARRILEGAPAYREYAVTIFDRPGAGQVLMQENASLDGPLAWYLRNSPEVLELVADLPSAIRSDPVHVTFGGPPAALEPLEPLLRASAAADHVHLTWTKYLARNVSLLDVMNRGCSKGSALTLWARRCGIPRHKILAIGDNYNDLEMLQAAGQPVLMGNHCDGLAWEGCPVTLSNDQDGVAAAVETYILRRPD